jgi:ATP-dependent helicase/nuclease subunit A
MVLLMSGGRNWTKEQMEAITGQNCNMLVSAAAGAGKTAVLVERIIHKITDDDNHVDIDRLLVMTFTNAAASEMRERIAGAIAERLEKNPGSRNILRQLTLLDNASITTIHSFCLEVIRSNFQLIGIDPGFRVADETESRLIKLEALNDVFEEQYELEYPDFYELLECYGGNRDDQALQDLVLSLYDYVRSIPWPEEWLNRMCDMLNIPDGTDFSQTPWGKVIIHTVRLELEGFLTMIGRALDLISTDSAQDGNGMSILPGSGLEKYYDIYDEDYKNLSSVIDYLNKDHGINWDSLFIMLHEISFKTLPRAGKNTDREKHEIIKKIRNDVKSGIKKLREKVVIALSDEIAADLKNVYPKIKFLCDLVNMLSEKYSQKKMRRTIVDFNDLEHFCLEILSVKTADGTLEPSETAQSYRERFCEILVDEYQDSNLVQEIIINMISGKGEKGPNIFMVGDVKQSIYRFRQAKPELFLQKYKTYSTEKGSPSRKILLYKNFRSRAEVLDAVNFIFKQIMSVEVGEIDYTDTERLDSGAEFPEYEDEKLMAGGKTELHLFLGGVDSDIISENEYETEEEKNDENNDPENDEILDNIQYEARLAGQRIINIMKPDESGGYFCVLDRATGEYRRVEYRDIVILLRTTKNWSEAFTEELLMMGIPVFADTGTGFFKTVEILVMMSLLQIIDNPMQDIPLLSVLRSPIGGFTTDELVDVRLAAKKTSLFEALQTLAESGKGETALKASTFIQKLHRYREMSQYMPADKLIWQLYTETGYYGMVAAMPSGEQRQANLRLLFEYARRFEDTSYKGLFNFINFIDKIKSSRSDFGSAKILGENENVVRIMSIHKSKGLEFPVVIVAGCGKRFNLQDINKNILLHQELGFGPEAIDYSLRLSWPTAAKLALREKIRAETLSEEMRILYVALTRAREKLIIIGTISNIASAAVKWSDMACNRENRLSGYDILKAANYLDWICPALLRHKSCAGFRESIGFTGGIHQKLIDDPSLWLINLWNKSDIQSIRHSEERKESEFIKWLDSIEQSEGISDLAEEVSKRLGWNYPYLKISKVPAKVSVTELKRRFNAAVSEETGSIPEYLPALNKKPFFLIKRKALSAAEKGIALHFVMQHLDYYDNDIESQIKSMVERDLITPQQAQSIDADKIRRFLSSPVGTRMLASKKINREVPFNIEIPCHELYAEMNKRSFESETILLQGIIDCYFEEPDGIVLVDYKTDYVTSGGLEEIKERYRVQLQYYSRALETLIGKNVKEKYIYLFHIDKLLDM